MQFYPTTLTVPLIASRPTLKVVNIDCSMPKPEANLIDKLTLRPEVREKAHALLRLVHSKTGPGTGYDVGEAKAGLPAICAYIASKRYALYVTVYAFYFIYRSLKTYLVLVMQISPKKSHKRHPASHPKRSPAR